MPGFPFPWPTFQGFDNNGDPLSGGLAYFYAAGTSTPINTYTDATLTTPNSNPVVLDAYGRAAVFVPDGTSYKIVVKDSAGNTLYTRDAIEVPTVPAAPSAGNLPIGGMCMYGGSAAPTGFLICNGSAISRATYAGLFAILGTSYGVGNGSTTFNLPDLRQKFPLGLAASGTGSALGASGGAIDHTHTGPSHTHTVAAHSHTMAHTHSVPFNAWPTQVNTPPLAGILQAGGSGSGSEASVTQANANNTTGASSAANTGTQALTTDASGTGNTGIANPPFQVVNYIIRYQ